MKHKIVADNIKRIRLSSIGNSVVFAIKIPEEANFPVLIQTSEKLSLAGVMIYSKILEIDDNPVVVIRNIGTYPYDIEAGDHLADAVELPQCDCNCEPASEESKSGNESKDSKKTNK
jgi:hypothetical protein